MQDDRRVKKLKQRAYAGCIYNTAKSIGGLDETLRVRDELHNLMLASMANANIFDAFRGIDIQDYTKSVEQIDYKSLVDNVFSGASKALKNTLYVIADNRDMYLVPGMFDIYTRICEEDNNVYIVDVETVVTLDDRLRKLIIDKAKKDLNHDVILHEHINEKIVGGIVMSVHNKVVDCSLLYLAEKARMDLTSLHHLG